MIRQDDKRFGEDKTGKWITAYGCAFMSVLYYCNKYLNIPLNIAKIKIYFDKMVEEGCFTDDLDIIWYKAFSYLGMKVSVKVESSTYKAKKNEFLIGEWFNEKTGLRPFTPVTGNIATYDSLGVSKTVSEGKLVSVRVCKIIK